MTPNVHLNAREVMLVRRLLKFAVALPVKAASLKFIQKLDDKLNAIRWLP